MLDWQAMQGKVVPYKVTTTESVQSGSGPPILLLSKELQPASRLIPANGGTRAECISEQAATGSRPYMNWIDPRVEGSRPCR